ncbi:allophanate hydrolase [Acinetobacter sp. HY1485]|uniref:allophanate hydrolase n=1 Tax=Acinetobacter sp. HY1485 TaxID=2970918 RepID=UPI0022B9850A|nr:allophanate hydrolase [Acinetobacter sp. HY1485]
MKVNDLKGLTIAQWQDAYRSKKIDLSILNELVAQFDPNDPAWISVVDSATLSQQLDALQGQEYLPLYGIPFAVKDNIDVAGFATTAACKALQQIKQNDAYVVGLLKQAGAVVVGKTNLDQFATGLVGTRSPFGAVPNSFDAHYVSGGSSSGSASVVARGLVPFALGTDTAGSGRVPAGFNNIVGLKPSKGRFSNTGLVPACKTLDCISIFALTASDAGFVAHIMERYDPTDSYSQQNPHTSPAQFASSPQFAVPKTLEFFGDTQSEQAFKQSLKQLKDFGATLIEIDFSAFEQLALQLYQGSWVAERTAVLQEFLTHHLDDFDPTVLKIVQQGEKFSAIDAYQAEYLRASLTRVIQNQLAQFDALIVPTSPTIHTLEEMQQEPIAYNSQFGTYTNFTNLADLSALALPATFRADGLPFGITLIAPKWHDQALVNFGEKWQKFINISLGALHKNLPTTIVSVPVKGFVDVAVVGAHLTQMPLNHQLTQRNAVLISTATTSDHYALYDLNLGHPPKPGLVRQTQGTSILLEIWRMPIARFGEFVTEIPSPLGIGMIELQSGEWVKGFICEPYAIQKATDISEFGGWKAYLSATKGKENV